MKTANLVWGDPPAPLTSLEIAMKIAGATDFQRVNSVAPGVQAASVPDLVDGTYAFRVTVINGTARGVGVEVTGTIGESAPPVDAVPGSVTGLAVTFA